MVAQDVWDGKRKQINGLVIFFIDPEDCQIYRIPIALLKPGGKSGLELSVLLAVNEAFLASCKPSVEEGKSIVEKVIEIFEKDDEIIDAGRELGLDPDGENFEDEDEE